MIDDRKTLPLKSAYPFGESHGLGKETAEIQNMVIEWDKPYTSSLRRGYVIELFEKNGILPDFIKTHWPIGATTWGKNAMRFWKRLKDRYQAFLAGNGNEDSPEIDEESDKEKEFAAEADLRDFLAKNPDCIERGLRIYESDGKRGVEFQIDSGDGRIDLLLLDLQGQFVVVELKVSRGRNKTLGQILYYMGWVDQNLAKTTKCRGIVVAKEITDDLIIATRRVEGISLMTYKLNVTLQKI
jgi:hypothetical protein